MNTIRHYLSIDENIASSGQPAECEFALIAQQGFNTVINLAMPTSDYALANEGLLVASAGMNYVHIPVNWELPQVKQFEFFAAIMQSMSHEKVWVHCALNMRVSVFLYLYRRLFLSVDDTLARAKLHEIWQPSEKWSAFIHDVIQWHALPNEAHTGLRT